MKNKIELGVVIAAREYNYSNEKGEKTLIIKLGKPRPDKTPGGDWECPIQIGENIKLIFGVDSFQALTLALKIISSELTNLNKSHKMNLTWLGMEDLGL